MNERNRYYRHRRESRLRRFLERNRFEVIWAAVVALGIFLILEPWHIRAIFYRWLSIGISVLAHDLSRLSQSVLHSISRMGLGDVVGLGLLLAALLMLLLRLRWRLMHTSSLTTVRCPRCGGEIHRVHRRLRDHLISWFVPVRRYHCSSRECRWSGVRVGAAEQRGRSASAPQ